MSSSMARDVVAAHPPVVSSFFPAALPQWSGGWGCEGGMSRVEKVESPQN